MDQNNVILVKQHFHTNGPDFNKDIELKQELKTITKKCIKIPKTYVPFGFNTKRNQPTKKE